ncbi:MAG: hypothetical protein ACRCXT_00595 [Paraclostridium sp.]
MEINNIEQHKKRAEFIANMFLEYILSSVDRVPLQDEHCKHNNYNYISHQGIQIELENAIKKAHKKLKECKFFKDDLHDFEVVAYNRMVINTEVHVIGANDYYKFIIDPKIFVTVFHISGQSYELQHDDSPLSMFINKASCDKGQGQIGVDAKIFGSLCTYGARYAWRGLLGITPGTDEEIDSISDKIAANANMSANQSVAKSNVYSSQAQRPVSSAPVSNNQRPLVAAARPVSQSNIPPKQ